VCVCVRVLSEKGLNELRTRQACARMWLKNPNSQYGFEGPLLSENSCILLGGVVLPFYRSKSTVYKSWFTGAYTVRLEKLPSQASPIAFFGRLRST
jgi:hypothetical protein